MPPGFSTDPKGPCNTRHSYGREGALPLDKSCRIILSFPSLPLCVAPERPGKPFQAINQVHSVEVERTRDTQREALNNRGCAAQGAGQHRVRVRAGQGTQTTAPHSLGLLLKHQNVAQRSNHHPCSGEWTWELQAQPLCTAGSERDKVCQQLRAALGG